MEELKEYKSGDIIYLDKEKTIKSEVNIYLQWRDYVVDVYEYVNCSGYGNPSRLFLCKDLKYDSAVIISQEYINGKWNEFSFSFGDDEFELLCALIDGNFTHPYGKHLRIKDF